jgi:RNA polymerase sigma factor (sigma-70 family)
MSGIPSSANYSDLYNQHFEWSVAWIARRVPEHAAEDIAQKTWIHAHQKLHQFRGESKFTSWLFAIARWKIVEYYRRRGKATMLPMIAGTGTRRVVSRGATVYGQQYRITDLGGVSVYHEDCLESRQFLRETVERIDKLPNRERDVMKRFMRGEQQGQISREVGISVYKVKHALASARRKLKET